MQYFDMKKNWRRVKRHIANERVQEILVRDFGRFTLGRWGTEFKPGQVPTEFESCDWQFNHRGRRPAFWAYTKHGACHWLTNFALVLAQRVEPQQSWRIITSPKHSTVWNGHGLLFDFNFLAMGVPPDECFEMAKKHQLKPGKLMRVCLAKHVSVEKETKLLTMEDLLTAFQE